MKRNKQFKKAFGITENFNFADIPSKISNIKISRIIDDMGCPYCFPHGWETINATKRTLQRSWKKFREARWK